MSLYTFLAYLIGMIVVHNIINGARLRWRVMLRSSGKRAISQADQIAAVCVGVLPLLAVGAWLWFSFKRFSEDGNLLFGVVAWLLTAGLGGVIICLDVYRALSVYFELRAARSRDVVDHVG